MSAASRSRRIRSAVLLVALTAAAAGAAAAGDNRYPVPTTTIYPRDVIRDEMLEDKDFTTRVVGGPALIDSRRALVGKAARATLLPGRPIPFGSVEDPKLVAVGAQVRIEFRGGGVTIVTFGAALQQGAEGELVRVRNGDSGLTVSGVVQPDGSVRVGDS